MIIKRCEVGAPRQLEQEGIVEGHNMMPLNSKLEDLRNERQEEE